jgi:alkylation response protein AidB-like acyl-CoA dehydrogenase
MTISFEPTEEQRMMRDTVAEFAKEKLRAKIRETEAARALSPELRQAAAELGLGALWTPEAYGGSGTDLRTAVLVEEELAFGDAGAAFAIPGPGALVHALLALGDEAQCKRVLEPFSADPMRTGAVAFSEARGSAIAGLSTKARRDGDDWVIDGTKKYVLNAGLASTYVVFAQTDEAKGYDGISAFVVDGQAKGLEASVRHQTTGLDAARFGEVTLKDVRVSEADRLQGNGDFAAGLRRFFARQSLQIAARAVGLSRAGWELARDYADERKAFGKAIGHFQAIAFMLADRLMDVDGVRGLVWRAAWTLDGAGSEHWKKKQLSHARASGGAGVDTEALLRCAEAIAEAGEVAVRVGDDAVQIHGGAGFVRDFLAEKIFRDAKQMALCASSSTTSDQLFAALVLGAPLDPAVVLPMPEIQPIFI